MANINETLTHTETLGERASGIFAALVRRAADWREFRRTFDELSQLSDRDLSDLGIARCEIARIARESVYGR
ncbi:DUF1127 domain-containing protein [Halovulum dunhuangense]|uniref:DUF1127 domain-containing protein n=1 Tax=Halovulum dunhuangense TaxID=1505036 RepID=A0A849L5M6_9RHOB|nr:DUF1127 domain-containing protein [Halovulum dunhuangense]NNU81431.1 DUF1127 domain-containing protein [Halovulum dunhuangense]